VSRISAAQLRRCGLVPRYIQGPGAVGYVGTVLRSLGVRRALVVGGRTAMGVAEAHGLFKSLEAAGVGYVRQLFGVGPAVLSAAMRRWVGYPGTPEPPGATPSWASVGGGLST
jgi:hypothetical protein